MITYDNDQKNIDITRKNVINAGLADAWEYKLADVRESIEDKDADAFIMDIPDAAKAIENAKNSLSPGGYLVVYCPISEQARDVMRKMTELDMAETIMTEIIERDWVVHDGGTRPDFAKLGHTGFIVSGRRVN